MKEEDKIELRSEEFQEILGSIPPWILRWGIVTLAIIVALLLIGSSFFKYPDTIASTITLTGTTPATNIIARYSGKIQELYVKDNQRIKAGHYLAVIENPAKTSDILYLKKFLDKYATYPDSIVSLPLKDISLGNCQSLYSSYYTTLFQYIQFKELGYYLEKVSLMKERIYRNEKHYQDMKRQKGLIAQQLTIVHNQFRRDSTLQRKGLISNETLETTYNQYLQGQLSLENIHSTLENMQIQLAQLKENLLDTEYQYIDKKSTLETQIKSLAVQLLTEIQTWEMNYAIIAPISGEVTFTNYWTKNQNIVAGDIAFSIIPSPNGNLIGKALLPTVRSGKVEVGQKVNIRFNNFPDNEFGVVKGTIKNLSLIPVKIENVNHYVVEVALPNGLKTTYNKELPFMQQMEGQADIITNDLSLLERILLPLKKILTENL